MDWKYVILHIDLDSFYASVHIKNHPFLRGFPVIIGADPRNGNGRGVVSTCSYEARAFGIHSAMPISQAYKLCPHGIYICSGRQISFSSYHSESKHVMTLLKEYSEKFQAAGIDEAYLDVTDNWQIFGESPRFIAKHIQDQIQNKLLLPASIGVAESKSIAKIASDLNKPNGITVVPNTKLKEKLYELPTRKIVGVGKKTEILLQKKGIKTIGDIASMSRERLFLLLGEYGLYLRKVVLGQNYKEVGYFYEGRKSISSERTFGTDQNDWNVVRKKIKEIVSNLVERLKENDLFARTVSVKIRFQGYITNTRSYTFSTYLSEESVIYKTALKLLEEFYTSSKKIRLIGVRLSSLKKVDRQLSLLPFLKL
ncbi:MAG: DNA polymerase IV [Candidatus Hodarchaeota archaeon]